METQLQLIISKIDQIIQTQQIILKRLKLNPYPDIKPNKQSNNKNNYIDMSYLFSVDNLLLILKNELALEKKFNLAIKPTGRRVLRHLKTGDVREFEGIKRMIN